ncbi:4-hydroxy-tetrahydrodipicolinate synthase, chloroplastic isoform X1 [Sesamum indicum]|uniref:4-hydroxy-tetrahydrodipicolinate synthase n=1 Tax=Sesamum indicum TaxID=4182 RepID=A0A6I9TRG7_SESIN|nr:4-hydroxy-tetrahydrodipicolinate synthase, chloroplastic isoform X1 [Sesamum indicum]
MASAIGCCSLKVTHQGGMPKWRSPRAAVVPNFHLPMRSYEVKNSDCIIFVLCVRGSHVGVGLLPNPVFCILGSIGIKMLSHDSLVVFLLFVLSILATTSVDDVKSLRLITAIKTPYLPDGRFDLEAYDTLVNMQIEDGVEGVIVGGTTGEGQLMSWDEHIMLIGHTVNCFGGSIKVIGNTGSNSTREAIHATEQGFAVGMHAALHINPYYGKTSLEGLVSHFDSVLSMGPTIIYNVPSRTGQDIPPRVVHTLAQRPNLAGIKECVGNDRVKQYTSHGLVVWSGNDDQCHDSRWDYGATGVISVTSNLVPGLMRELMFGGKNPSLNSKLTHLIEWLFQEPNPISLNTALAQLGVVRPVFRLPYVPLPLAKRVEFVNIVKDLGRENFVGDKNVQVLDDNDFILIGRY